MQLKGASSFKQINCVEFTDNRGKLKKTIEQAYRQAPYFSSAWPVINDWFDLKTNFICELAIHSVVQVSKYLNIDTPFETSSIHYAGTKKFAKAERLKEICRINNTSQYINPIGGVELYGKDDFAPIGVDLSFIKTKDIKYTQGKNDFIPWLSIIDVMMFNSVATIRSMLDEYELV